MEGVRVLLIEDEPRMAAAIRRGLRAEGIVADVVTRGRDALGMVRTTEFDAVVLDVMLPDLDGFETCRRLRADGLWVPIIMLTARDAVEDRVRGLDEGGRRLPDQALLPGGASGPAASARAARARSAPDGARGR